MSLEQAIASDRAGDIVAAADLYEQVLDRGGATLQALLNAIVLYWQATDPGLSAAKKLSAAFIDRASKRMTELLAQAERAFPESTEVAFWSRYIAWADLGEELSPNLCRELLRRDPACSVPAMFIFSQTNGAECEPEARGLLARCQQDQTARSRYVASVIAGVLKRTTATMQLERTFTPPHPVVFLFDFESEAELPVVDAPVRHTPSCVAIGTIADVDGDVTVSIVSSREAAPTTATVVFEGSIRCPNRRVDFVSSENERLVGTSIRDELAHVTVLVDDIAAPSHVWAVVGRRA